MKNWMRKHKKLLVVLVVLVILAVAALLILPRFFKRKNEPTKQVRQNTVELSKMDLTESVSATGTIESAKVKTVSAGISNVEVKSVKVSEGDTVKKGQTLVTFEQSDLQTALTEAQENYADAKTQANSDLTSAKRKLSEARETYKTQKKQLDKNVADAKSSYKDAKKAVSTAKTPDEKQKAEETLSQAETAYEQAKTERTSSNKQNRSSIEEAKEQLTTTQSNNKKTLREAQRSLTSAKEEIASTSVTAPMSGVVTAVGVEAGDTYTGGDMIEISDCNDLQVTTTITEYDIANVEKGQRVVILTDATDETEIEGEITYVALTTGSSSLNSSSAGGSTSSMSSSGSSSGYEVRIAIKDSNDLLRVGMTAKCSIILKEASDVYAVPYDAVHSDTDGNDVIYVKDSSGTKKEIAVTVGMESDYYVEVQSDELSEGLEIIIPSDDTSSSDSSSNDNSSTDFSSLMGGGDKGGGGFGGGGAGGGGGGMPAGGPGM